MNARLIVILLFWGTVFPPVVTLLVWVYGLHLEAVHLLQAVSFRLYAAIALAALVTAVVQSALARSRGLFCLYLGLLLLALQGVAWYGFRFSGMASVGVDEQVVDYYRTDAGVFVSAPRLPVRVSRVTEEPPGVTLEKDGIETRIGQGSSAVRDGCTFRLESVERAPLVSVRSVRGELVDEAYLKGTGTSEAGDYVMFGRLPHRFYVREAKGARGRFRLSIIRDKITIVDQTVTEGDSVYFDGHFVTCRPGASWARLAVEKNRSKLLLVAGLTILGIGIVTSLAGRLRRPR